jgi:hypothetical protein
VNPFLFTYQCCGKDIDLAVRNATRIAETTGKCGDPCLLSITPSLRLNPKVDAIVKEMKKSFSEVEVQVIGKELGHMDGWTAQNYMFGKVVYRAASTYRNCTAFFFMEPDCYPVRRGWWEDLKAEYEAGGKPYMGVERPTMVKLPGMAVEPKGKHLNGVAFYPTDVLNRIPGIANIAGSNPWDALCGSRIHPHATKTKAIWIDISHKDWNARELEELPKEVVLIHGNKDGSLFSLERPKIEQKSPAKEPEPVPPIVAQPEPPPPQIEPEREIVPTPLPQPVEPPVMKKRHARRRRGWKG